MQTEVDRSLQQDQRIAKKSGVPLIAVTAFREVLAKYPSQRLRRFWFGNDHWPEELSDAQKKIRKILSKQSDLFKWVYGKENPHAIDAQYVRLPTLQKKRLVNLILTDSRSRYPWLTSKLLHAMAYSPDSFEKIRPTVADYESWGPLYRRVSIQKGSGRRRRDLLIPNPPLKRVQKSLLRLLGPSLESHLLPNVYGIARNQPAPVFRNAVTHCNSKLIVSFDIRDFFPSTSVSAVLRGIRFASKNSPVMVDERHLPENLSAGGQARRIDWSHDAEVLVARLATHRGRLPQGSPLSPLLANIAFAPHDAKLVEVFNQAFGEKGYHYTRYFDDITISFNASATISRVDQKNVTRLKCQELLERVLLGSGYQLNARKTICSEVQDGHQVTGLVVRKGEVSLPRKKVTRMLRAVTHSMKHKGFVETARRWASQENRPAPEWESLTNGHRWIGRGLNVRRVSVEKMATMMLRQICRDLSGKRLLETWFAWQERFSAEQTTIEGKDVFDIVEYLLSLLWRDSISPQMSNDGKKIVFTQKAVPVCELAASNGLSFFQLSKNDAVAVIEFWHYLRGMRDYLKSCPAEPEFNTILAWRHKLEIALASIQIKTPEVFKAPNPELQSAPETVELRIFREWGHFKDSYEEFSRYLELPMDLETSDLLIRLSQTVISTLHGYTQWVEGVANLLVERLPFLPTSRKTLLELTSSEFFEYLRLKNRGFRQLVYGKHDLVEKFEQGLQGLSADEMKKFQVKFIQYLLKLFREASRQHQQMEHTAWQTQLESNEQYLVPVDTAIADSVRRIIKLFKELSSPPVGERTYLPQAVEKLLDPDTRIRIASCDFEVNTDRAWKILFAQASYVFISLRDSIDEAILPSLSESLQKECEKRHRKQDVRGFLFQRFKTELGKQRPKISTSRITLLKDMRNRKAHGPDATRREDWVKIQKLVARILERKWSEGDQSNPDDMHSHNDLAITGYEAALVWRALLESVEAFLESIPKFLENQQNELGRNSG